MIMNNIIKKKDKKKEKKKKCSQFLDIPKSKIKSKKSIK